MGFPNDSISVETDSTKYIMSNALPYGLKIQRHVVGAGYPFKQKTLSEALQEYHEMLNNLKTDTLVKQKLNKHGNNVEAGISYSQETNDYLNFIEAYKKANDEYNRIMESLDK